MAIYIAVVEVFLLTEVLDRLIYCLTNMVTLRSKYLSFHHKCAQSHSYFHCMVDGVLLSEY